MSRLILVIEDDESIREFVSTFLRDEGFEVALAENGAAGLKIAQQCNPSLTFVDVLMPVMDGKSFVEAYRKLPVPHNPVIGMSANTYNTSLLSIFDGFLNKPFNLEDMLACIRQYF